MLFTVTNNVNNQMSQKQHTTPSSSCIVSFLTKEEMAKAFNVLLYDIDVCFSGIDSNTIKIPKNACKILEEKGIKLNHILSI
ncbi:MAG: hypothetical protein ACPKPY_07605 [Nitrososphaeraceae archaeon]